MELKTVRYSNQKWSAPLPDWDSEKTLVLVFGAPEFGRDQDSILKTLKSQYPLSVIAGCSSAGEVFQYEVSDHSLSVAILRFKSAQLKCISKKVKTPDDSEKVGREIARELEADALKGVLIFSDGLSVNGSMLVSGISHVLGDSVPITGGLAGDGPHFKRTWVLHDGVPNSHYVTAIGFLGEGVHIEHGTQGGWGIFGPERTITKSEGNVLYEIDGLPALDLYKKYLGEKADELPASGLLFPLQIRESASSHPVVRTILSVNEKSKSLTFAGDIPQGWTAQFMRASMDRLVDGAQDAAQQIQKTQTASPHLLIAISCVGRRLVLGQRVEEEIEATLDQMPEGTEQIGFYSYGEIAPHSDDQQCELHNQTMTLTLISEAA